METKNIISIRKTDISLANVAFVDFMDKTETRLNEIASMSPKEFSSLTAFQLEALSVESMKEICSSTPFRREEIRLVSGQSFPDIVAETYYGVEVKSTQSDTWKSTGSSIIETTRNKNVERIYMLFGKLGGVPKVKCKPYEECLYDITVTHSPRYLIDMNISHENTIFSKMRTSYDDLRKSCKPIAQVRKYYRDKAKKENRNEMPWWIDEVEDLKNQPNRFYTESNMMIRHITSLTQDEKKKIIMQLYVLFPQCMIESLYLEPAMWLVAYHGVVCHNMRDNMSAGGKAKYLNNRKLRNPVPAIVKNFLQYSKVIKTEIEDMYAEIDVYNPTLLLKNDLFLAWVEQVDSLLKKKYGQQIQFANWVANGDTLSVDTVQNFV